MSERVQTSSERLWRDLFEEKGSAQSLSVLLREAALRRKARARQRRLYLVAAAGLLGLFALSWWAMPGRDHPLFAREKKETNSIPVEALAKELSPKRNIPPAPPRQSVEGPAVAQIKTNRPLDIPGVKTISDEELLDRMRGMPIALVGPKGHRRVVFLNEPAARVSAQEAGGEEGAGSWE
jgi:hypothetical protein